MTDDTYYFDDAAADRVCRFFEEQLRQWKAPFAGQLIKLLPWERQLLRDVFGWKNADGSRRYRTIYAELPRKNGKSLISSGILLFLFCADGEAGAECYALGQARKQANIAFKNCVKFVKASPALRKRIQIYKHSMEYRDSILEPWSGEHKGAVGQNIHGLSLDELWEWNTSSSRDLYDALTTSQGARTQPLTVCITTAPNAGDTDTVCMELHNKARRYLTGEMKPDAPEYDPTFYPIIYSTDKQWDTPEAWREANPSLGATVSEKYLADECRKAKGSPAAENAFRRFYLCQIVEATTRWLDLSAYDACTGELPDLDGQPCYIGIDLSIVHDLSAVVALYPLADCWVAVPRLYMPRATAEKRQREHGTPFPRWIDEGYIVGTDGPTVDMERIEADLLDLAQRCPVIEAAYDPYNAGPLVRHLEDAGLTTVPAYQTFLTMSPACKELEKRLIEKSILFPQSPALRWQAASAEIQHDRHDNYRLVKPGRTKYAGSPKYSIDALVATVIAISRARLQDTAQEIDAAPQVFFV
ncbi:MAG: hypothetical protein BIFFINMI_03579 [Phycisphaerae bacterium]|nr:hypothetical protein [Phycisphaerae bacterium]